ncbi:ARP2/3 actin-organizing complex subunit Arc34 [Orbilia javanica]|uniref:Arp2/3 complex 34 kDa subunit n=1 Tax=Orbilia javanica TaxID=47235 RepID=A0AAN8MN13_9PEZI
MLLLEYHNLLIHQILTERFNSPTPASIDQVIPDFDGVIYHISTPDTKTKILVSLSIKCYSDLIRYGAQEVLQREYGDYIVEPESGYDFSLLLDLESLPQDQEKKDDLIRRVSLLKRNAMAAPFERAFDTHYTLSAESSKFTSESAPSSSDTEVMAIQYRDEEAIYIKPSHDRVTVIFSTVFREETDRIFGKVFLQEFVDARRRAIQNAPQVLYRTDPPLEIRGLKGVVDTGAGDVGYVTFVLFPRHLKPDRRDEVISHIQTFRDYFHYHIKAAKAYMHSRMRKRVSDFQKYLNRAKPENADKERKTASGRSFRVQS